MRGCGTEDMLQIGFILPTMVQGFELQNEAIGTFSMETRSLAIALRPTQLRLLPYRRSDIR
jgi:hypothetical protein